MELIISPKKITKMLTIIVTCLVLASFAGQFYEHFLGHDRHIVRLFDLDIEWNIPTWYSSITLTFCSMLLCIIAFAKKNTGSSFFHWIVLSIIFLLLAMDEAIQFHEMTITPLRTLLDAKGVLYFTWVVPGGAFLIIFVVSFLKFLSNLPGKSRLLFVISGILYVGGALGMELAGGYWAYCHGQKNMTYAIITNAEETLEMVGILVFIQALMSYISCELKELRIRISDKETLFRTDR